MVFASKVLASGLLITLALTLIVRIWEPRPQPPPELPDTAAIRLWLEFFAVKDEKYSDVTPWGVLRDHSKRRDAIEATARKLVKP